MLYQLLFIIILATIFVAYVDADCYMHSPRGSNDRNCETNENRDNANRLFDSQNNGKGGYACPRAVGGPDVVTPTMYFYVGSLLTVQWTQQHSCGTDNNYCDIVLQYMCDDTAPDLRDGTPQSSTDPATTTVPFDSTDPTPSQAPQYGVHEDYYYYKRCTIRYRNANLFLADRQLQNGGQLTRTSPATHTRQNPNGERHGFECPEERDYYPYWGPTPWKDVAIFTANTSRCDWIRKNSQNVASKGDCRKSDSQLQEALPYNNADDCVENGGVWKTFSAYGIDPPECLDSSSLWTRDNQLGSNDHGLMSIYNWTVPNDVHSKCILRIRYNISTADYNPVNIDEQRNGYVSPVMQDEFIGGPVPADLKPNEDADVDYGYGWELATAINTNQYGRTFQDRSYVFEIRQRPSTISPKAKIYNLNVRGKRGNIVQTFPAVEYDFVPNYLIVQGGDYLHIQWTGSDYNPNRQPNDAEGGPTYLNTQQTRADRSNLLQIDNSGVNLPRKAGQVSMFLDEKKGTVLTDLVQKLALINQPINGQNSTNGQPLCVTYRDLTQKYGLNQNTAETDNRNCGKLNGATTPYFDAGLVRMVASGSFKYYSSRNNNFSNRSQKGQIVVDNGWFAAANRASPSLIYVMASCVLSIFLLAFVSSF